MPYSKIMAIKRISCELYKNRRNLTIEVLDYACMTLRVYEIYLSKSEFSVHNFEHLEIFRKSSGYIMTRIIFYTYLHCSYISTESRNSRDSHKNCALFQNCMYERQINLQYRIRLLRLYKKSSRVSRERCQTLTFHRIYLKCRIVNKHTK